LSHFAEINENNEVIRVIVGDNSLPNEGYDWVVERLGGRWIQTSYNNNFRGRFASQGMIYLEDKDCFVFPKPFQSWVFDETTKDWTAPIPYPNDGVMYKWDEDSLDWVAINFQTEN